MSDILWEKSKTWRSFVRRSKESKPFLISAGTIVVIGIPLALSYGWSKVADYRSKVVEERIIRSVPASKLEELSSRNREFLADYFEELKENDPQKDKERWAAAMRGQILPPKPRPKPIIAEEAKKQNSIKISKEQNK